MTNLTVSQILDQTAAALSRHIKRSDAIGQGTKEIRNEWFLGYFLTSLELNEVITPEEHDNVSALLNI
jgi:hypothetical protein